MANIFDEIEEKASQSSASRNVFDEIEDGTYDDKKPSAIGSFAREVARSVAPGLTATAIAPAAARVATALAPRFLRPVAPVLGALGGAMATGLGVRKAQDVVADKIAPESIMGTQSAQADFEENPIASVGGGIIAAGKPSLSVLKGAARAVGTSEGRAGVAQVAKSLVNKDASAALTKAVEAGELGARRAMEDFSNLLGSAAGFGAQAGMEVAQGRDLPTAAAIGLAGVANRPWVGPGGVFLSGPKPKPSVLADTPEAAPVEDGAPAETAPTPEEQQLVDDAIAGKIRAVEATEQAANVAESTGTLPQVAKALRQQAERVARKPVTPPVDPAAETPLTPAAKTPRTRAKKSAVAEAPVVAPEAPAPEAPVVAPEAAPVARRPVGDSTRVPDEVLLAGVAQSKTKEEFVDWAKQNGYGETLRPASGGQVGASVYWSLNRPAATESAPAPAPEAPAPEAPAPEAPAPEVPVAPEVAAEPVAANITKEARARAEKLGIDVTQVPPNKQGNVSRRDVDRWVKANLPQTEEPPVEVRPKAPKQVPEQELPTDPPLEEAPPVPEQEPPLVPNESPLAPQNVDTSLQVLPPNRDFSGTELVNLLKRGIDPSAPITGVEIQREGGRSGSRGVALSPYRQELFKTAGEAERALGGYDRNQVNDFYDRVHNELGPGVKENPRAAARITREDAMVGLSDGFAASSLSRFSGATGWNWIRTLETLKTLKSGNPVDIFRQRTGGEATLYEVTTNTDSVDSVNQQLRESGIVGGATLVKNPETNTVQVYVLTKRPSQASAAIEALKRFVYTNNYGKIKSLRGDAETISPDIESATVRLRESLGQYTGGGSRNRAGGADWDFVANNLRRFSREVGIDLGPIQDLEAPRLDSRGRPLKDKVKSAFGYERDAEQLKAAMDKIPADKQARFMDLYVRAYDQITNALGFPRLNLAELGSLAEKSSGNEVLELYVERLRKLYADDALVPQLKQRRNLQDRPTDYGASFSDQSAPFPEYRSVGGDRRDSLPTIALGDIIADLAKRVDEKPVPARKTKKNLAKIEAIDKRIEALRADNSRAKRTPKAVKKELDELLSQREAADTVQSPWDKTPEEFSGYVRSKLMKALDKVRRAEANAEKAGVKSVEDAALSGDEKESVSFTENAADSERMFGENAPGIDENTKKAAYEALRNENLRSEDRYAIGKMLVQSGALNLNEIRALTPEVNKLARKLDALDQRTRDKNSALTIESQTPREMGELLSKNYTLEELVAQKHRRKDGRLRATRLYRPGEEAPVGERAEPPKVISDINARAYLEILLRGEVATEDAAQIRQLLKSGNLDNIPLRVYDYLPRGEYGYYNTRTGEIAINRERLGAPDSNVETGLHEVHHALLRYFLDVNNSGRLNSRQRKLVGDLTRMYEQTTKTAIEDGLFSQETLDQLRSRLASNPDDLSLPTDEYGAAFSFSNIDEWASAMMSNPEFRDYMKSVEMRDVVTGKLRTAWETFKDFVAKLFGMDRSVYRKSFDKIMELATDPGAGRVSDGELLTRPAMAEKPRFTRKVSEAKVNERLSDKDKVMFDSQQVSPALAKAMDWKANGGRLEDVADSNLLNPEKLQAAELFYEDAMAVKASVDRMKKPTAEDLAARRAAEDDIVKSQRLVGMMVSAGAQVMGHSQHLGSRRTINIEDVYKTLLGKTPEELASGKVDLQVMMDGIRGIKAEAAETTMLALETDLRAAGISGERSLKLLQDTLAHPSSSYRDLLVTMADIMPGAGEAKVRAMAERIFRIYSTSATTISKTRLPKLIRDTYNGETNVPATDKFLKKLSEFVKLGKYSDDEINSTVLESLGLSGYDKEFIAGIRKDLFKIASMPEGQMRDAASVEVNQKVKSKLYNNVLKFDPSVPEGRKHIMDMLTAAWQAGVLSGPPTSIVNLVGSNISTTLESFMEATGYALRTGDLGYYADVWNGFLSALLGNKATGRGSAALTEARSALSGKGTKFRNEAVGDTPTLENIDVTGTSAPVKLVGSYAQKLRYVGRVMQALDAVNMTMADEAKQRMVARFFLTQSKGHRSAEVADMMHQLFDPDEVTLTTMRQQAEQDVKTYLSDKSAKEQERWVTRRTLELMTQRREQLVPNIAEAGKGAAERFTYNETAQGFLGKTMVNLSAQINEALPAGRFVLSFMNTLANIMNQTLDYTPYGFARAKNKWRVGTVDPNTKYARRVYKEGSPEQMAQMARASLGTSIMMALAYMAYKGYEAEENGEVPYFTVTGAGPKNGYDRQQLMDTGAWRPNSVKIGETWYRYVDLPVVGPALGFMGTMIDAARYKKDDQTDAEVVWNAALAGATTVFDKQLLQGANNFFEMLRGSQPGQQVFAMKRLVGGIVGGYTNPGMVRWMRETLDMDAKGNVDRLDRSTTAGWVASMIPFSIGYNTAALNTLGEPIQQPWYSATTWRFADFNKSKPHPIITPLVQAGLMLQNPSARTSFTYANPSDGSYITTRLGKHPEVMRRFVELRGETIKRLLTPAQIASLQQVAAKDPDSAQDYLDGMTDDARKYAIKQIEQEISEGKLKL